MGDGRRFYQFAADGGGKHGREGAGAGLILGFLPGAGVVGMDLWP